MKLILVEFNKKTIFSQSFETQIKVIDMNLAWVFNINKEIILENNDRDIELFGHDFIKRTLNASQSVEKPKTY